MKIPDQGEPLWSRRLFSSFPGGSCEISGDEVQQQQDESCQEGSKIAGRLTEHLQHVRAGPGRVPPSMTAFNSGALPARQLLRQVLPGCSFEECRPGKKVVFLLLLLGFFFLSMLMCQLKTTSWEDIRRRPQMAVATTPPAGNSLQLHVTAFSLKKKL